MRLGHIVGMDAVLLGLNREVERIKRVKKSRLRKAALVVKAHAMRLTPVDTGNLRASAYVNPPADTGTGPTVTLGYTASYAPYVHEIDANYRVGQWKFLETALRERQRHVMDILKGRALL